MTGSGRFRSISGRRAFEKSRRGRKVNDNMHGDGEHDGGPHGEYGPWVWTAYRAYNELLREKIKKRFDAQEGPWMDQLAQSLVELVNARWEGGRKAEKTEEELLARIDKLLQE